MADDLRLYFLEGGSLKTQVQSTKVNQGWGTLTRSRFLTS